MPPVALWHILLDRRARLRPAQYPAANWSDWHRTLQACEPAAISLRATQPAGALLTASVAERGLAADAEQRQASPNRWPRLPRPVLANQTEPRPSDCHQAPVAKRR